MILQNIIFPSTDTCTEEEMYFRRNGEIDYSWSSEYIQLNNGSSIYFDTYFNGFSADKWFKYTSVKKIFLTVKISGKFRITLLRKEKFRSEIYTEYVSEQIFKSKTHEPEEFIICFDTASVNGMYCFDLMSMGYNSKFYGGYYSADIFEKNIRYVKLAIDICTYKRERYLEANIRKLNNSFLKNKKSCLYDNLEVFISDNAHTLDIKELSDDKITIVQNKNVGGAGGFTRGMIEINNVSKQKKITHILVMDDDVYIEPESIYRTFILLSCVKEEYKDAFVGGAMLRMDHQYLQVESGAVWNGGDIISFKRGLDLRNTDACLFNEIEEGAQYNAWWYCAFPIDIVNNENLPMPVFIRGDDIEYGLRNMKSLILMNGICVWHESFENKYSSFLFYYILRNRLIDNSLHNMKIPKKNFINIFKKQVLDEIRLYRYKNANLLMRGVEDFLKGPDWLAQQDGETLHQNIISEGYKLEYLEDLEEKVQLLYPLYESSLNASAATGLKARIINHFTLNGTYLSPKRTYNVVPTVGTLQSTIYRTDLALNYDYTSRKGFVTKRDPAEAKKSINRLKKICKQINHEYDEATRKYSEDGRKLMTRKFWNKYLGIE